MQIKLLVLDSNTWNNLTVYKWALAPLRIIFYKLFVFKLYIYIICKLKVCRIQFLNIYIYIYIYIHGKMVDFGKSDIIRKTSGKIIGQNTDNG